MMMLLASQKESNQPAAATIFFAASVMSAPAALVIGKIIYPEKEHSETAGDVKMPDIPQSDNAIEAASNGITDGFKLALNVGAMLLAFIALIALIDYPLNWIGEIAGFQQATGRDLGLSTLLGYVLSPVAWVIGVPWQDAVTVGGLIGQKIVTNEFVAYAQLSEVQGSMSPQAVLISTYALCGFANFSSIAIQIGGIGGIAPGRKSDLARLGLRAVLGGTLATMMTATIAGVLTQLA